LADIWIREIIAGQNRQYSNSSEKACGKLFKASDDSSTVKTVTDSQTKAPFCRGSSFYARYF